MAGAPGGAAGGLCANIVRRAAAGGKAQDNTRRSAGCWRRRKLRPGAPSARPVLKNCRAREQLRAMHWRGGQSKTPRSYAGRWSSPCRIAKGAMSLLT